MFIFNFQNLSHTKNHFQRLTFAVFVIKTPMICRGRPEAGVIDSPTWVVRGSDGSVAAETNISRQAANQSPGRAWGFI